MPHTSNETPIDRFKARAAFLLGIDPNDVVAIEIGLIDKLADAAITDPSSAKAYAARRIINDLGRETTAQALHRNHAPKSTCFCLRCVLYYQQQLNAKV